MSEYQYVAFRAVDKPVEPKQLEYMRKQSTRADITPWAFTNEYHYGDFRGDANEMLRRGYDVHLHFANFGTRKLLFRLPRGLPDAGAAAPYLLDDALCFVPDQQGRGGILAIDPYYDPGDYEDYWEFDDLLNLLGPLRTELLEGDLRPLYLAHLAVSRDQNHDPDDVMEASVPAGLESLTTAQKELAAFYSLDSDLLAVAAEFSPPLAGQRTSSSDFKTWLRQQSTATKDAWLLECVSETGSYVRQEILTAYRSDRKVPAWPIVAGTRTVGELFQLAQKKKQEVARKARETAARARLNRLTEMKADPSSTLRETERLAKTRTGAAYQKVAEMLAELREALAGTVRAGLAEQHAQTLKENHPTLKQLAKELRNVGFLPKKK